MNSQLSPRDWEILSAYLDRQLKSKEVARLEARLGSEPQLSAALGELQLTRDALRSLPKMRAPRNFTLTPQMVGQSSKYRPRPSARLAPVFGFASALATFILVLVVVGEITGFLTPSTKQVAVAPASTSEVALMVVPTQVDSAQIVEEQAAKESAPYAADSQMPTEAAVLEEQPLLMQASAPETITETAPAALAMEAQPPVTDTLTVTAKEASGMGGGLMEVDGEYPPPGENTLHTAEDPWTTTVEVTISPTQTLTFPMTVTIDGPETTELTNSVEDTQLAPEELPQAEFTEPPAAAKQLVPDESSALEQTSTPEQLAFLQSTPTPAPSELQVLQHAEGTSVESSPEPSGPSQAGLRILEISLAGLALVLGLAAVYFRWGRKL